MATGIEMSNLIPGSTESVASTAAPTQAVIPGEKASEVAVDFSETLEKAQATKEPVKEDLTAAQKKAVQAQDRKAAKLAKEAKEARSLADVAAEKAAAKEAKLKGEITDKDAAKVNAEKKPPTKAQLENSKKIDEVKAQMAKQKAEADALAAKQAQEAAKAQPTAEQLAMQKASEQKQNALVQDQKLAKQEKTGKVPPSALVSKSLNDAGKIQPSVANTQAMPAQAQAQMQTQTVLQPIIMPVAMPMVMMPQEVEVLEVEHPMHDQFNPQGNFDQRAAAALALSKANVPQHPLLMNASSQDFIQNRMMMNKPAVMQTQSQPMMGSRKEISDFISGPRSNPGKTKSPLLDAKTDTVAPGFILQNSMERLQSGQTITSQALQPVVNVNSTDEVASHVYGLATKGGGSVKVKINPVELGELTITVSNDKGKLNVHMDASTNEAKEILAQSVHELKSALTGSRFDVAGVEVTHSKAHTVQTLSHSADGAFDSRNGWDQQRGNGNPNSAWDRYFAQADEFNDGRGQRQNPYRGQYEQFFS